MTHIHICTWYALCSCVYLFILMFAKYTIPTHDIRIRSIRIHIHIHIPVHIHLSPLLGSKCLHTTDMGPKVRCNVGAPLRPYTIPYHTMPYHTIRYHTLRYDTIRYDTIRYVFRGRSDLAGSGLSVDLTEASATEAVTASGGSLF